MKHHSNATSAGSTEGNGDSRRPLRRAFAIRGASDDVTGSGAPSSGRLRCTLAVLAVMIAAFAVTACPASADTVKMGTVTEVSYDTAFVTGNINVTSPFVAYTFEYSTDQTHWVPGPSDFLQTGKNQVVKKTIEGLKGGTNYFVRLSSNNFTTTTVSPAPYPEFTTLPVDPPVITAADNASAVFSTSAVGTGKVKRPSNENDAFDVNCHFEYVTDTQFTSTGFQGATVRPCAQNPIGKADAGADKSVSALLGCTDPALEAPEGKCLEPLTTYHLRLSAENAAPGVITKDAGATFTTTAKVAAPTVVGIDNPTGVGSRGFESFAKASGEVQRPAGTDPALDVDCHFEYVTDAQFTENIGNTQPPFAGASSVGCNLNPVKAGDPTPTPVKADLNGLTPETTYHLRLTAANGGGADSKDAASTVTTPAPKIPVVTMDTPVPGYDTAEVSGTILPEGCGTQGVIQYYFQYSTEPANPESWTYSNLSGDQGQPIAIPCDSPTPVTVGGTMTGLHPGTEYSVRLRLEILPGEILSAGPNPSFTTKPVAPIISTLDPVSDISANTAHFSGTVSANAPGPLDALGEAAYETSWHVECTPACPRLLPVGSGSVKGPEGTEAISMDASELVPNTYYEVRLVSTNAGETSIREQTFQTPLVTATVKSFEGASDNEGGYYLQGFVNSNNSKLTSCAFEYGTTSNYPNTYQAPCLPNPSGPDEVQNVNVDATAGQFRLSFRGQPTGDLPFSATTAEVQTALRALPQVAPSGVNVTGSPGAYVVTFVGKLAGTNVAQIKGSDGSTPLSGGAISTSTEIEGGKDHGVTIEAHIQNLTINSHYHFRIFATNAAGTVSTPDREFVPTLAPPDVCPNAQLRRENGSTALPECRAYEQVTSPDKGGIEASLGDFSADGEAVSYNSRAGNIAGSGQAGQGGNAYVSLRTASGWKTLSNLNGPSGSAYAAPDGFLSLMLGGTLSADFRSAIWFDNKEPELWTYARPNPYLRTADGTVTKINKDLPLNAHETSGLSGGENMAGASDDLSHVVVDGLAEAGDVWGPGVYEFIGTNAELTRVDLDNSESPISSCHGQASSGFDLGNAQTRSVSSDGRVIVVVAFGGCGGANPPADELWARIGGASSIDVSASQCSRSDCNPPAEAIYQGSAKNGSRVFFTTTQQLVNADTDQTNDIYACDIPSGTPAPAAGRANPCTAFRQISVAESGAGEVETVFPPSEDGSAIVFTAKGVLAANEDALKEQAVAGDHNLYLWRQDSAHPNGQTIFVARLDTEDLTVETRGIPQLTPDGRDFIFRTANKLVETDTDSAFDIYRYDAVTGELARVSIGAASASGNSDNFNASIIERRPHETHPAISSDGEAVVFVTAEPLLPRDGNGESDAYLWKSGKVSLISTGAVGGGSGVAAISPSGRDIYFEPGTAKLTPSDIDVVADVYDARVEGGFNFPETTPCSGEACQPPPPPPPAPPTHETAKPGGEGNVKPCPKGKVAKGAKCVKKPHKKHHKKSHKKKRPSHVNDGGAK